MDVFPSQNMKDCNKKNHEVWIMLTMAVISQPR